MAELTEAVERGLPKSTLRHVARKISGNAREEQRIMRRVVPEATYKRRRERLLWDYRLMERPGATR